jgi:hypothetical protein
MPFSAPVSLIWSWPTSKPRNMIRRFLKGAAVTLRVYKVFLAVDIKTLRGGVRARVFMDFICSHLLIGWFSSLTLPSACFRDFAPPAHLGCLIVFCSMLFHKASIGSQRTRLKPTHGSLLTPNSAAGNAGVTRSSHREGECPTVRGPYQSASFGGPGSIPSSQPATHAEE